MANDKHILVYLNTLRQKGYLAYEYNPFHNYQTAVDLYEIETDFGKVLVPKGMAVDTKTGLLLIKKDSNWVDDNNAIHTDNDIIKEANNGTLYAKAGSLIDFETDKLNFDLEHPVDITVQPSYDGSVNLILNDGKNVPRLINSRFSVRQKDTYEIVDRIGENDTNIYNSESFDKDTSLYFLYERNPVVEYKGFVKGNLPVGQYCFYFTYCDADDNESDYITESGLIPVFLGSDRDPMSMDGGIKNLQSDKGIRLKLTNLDKSYNYLRVYFVRYFADYQQNRVYECKKFLRRTPINSNTTYILITGLEDMEDLDPEILNITRFNPKNVLTQAQCKNMLFFGNIVKNTDNYRELLDCALRIVPELITKKIETVDNKYEFSTDPGYYESKNIYTKVGYFNREYYRFGVVFIYNNGTLSNVYNTLGGEIGSDSKLINSENIFEQDKENPALLKRIYIKSDDEGWIEEKSINLIDVIKGNFLNSKGVIFINEDSENLQNILGIKFKIDEKIIKYLKEDLNIRGLFFVRQKCIPTILGLCYLLPMDEILEGPVLKYKEENQDVYVTETFVDNDLKVVNGYNKRLYKYTKPEDVEGSISINAYAAICPDFLLNLPYYNQIFNGSKFRLQRITNSSNLRNVVTRYYSDNTSEYTYANSLLLVKICSVTENVPSVAIQDKIYKLEMGYAEEAFRFKYAEIDNGAYDYGKDNETKSKDVNKATNIVRGIFSPYLAIYSEEKLEHSLLYNIYLDIEIEPKLEYLIRMNSAEPFYAISDRYNFEDIINYQLECWRGDCYINTFTFRLNRNFNDPSLPNNDVIVDQNTWKDNYDVTDLTKWSNISRSDLNAVQMGSWITFKVRSACNYALRSEDHSYVSEEALMGSPRSYFPRKHMMWKGVNKMPDSYLYNDAYRATLGYKRYFTLQDVNYIKDTFSNRIQYSAIAIQDSYKNNFRYSLSTYFRDYSMEYGSITKLIGFEGYLLVVFEHAVAIAVINERILAGQSDGEPVFINTQNVLPEELTIISDTLGSQWGESVVKSEAGYVYGIDTIAKKIWRVQGQQIEILSDMKVNKFLVDNITLGEREKYPIIGLKNVKTHYNNNKKDVIFTFYDDIYKDEESVWSLCYNELMGEFITFYSWLPSYSENIDTLFFTFNRDTSKEIALLQHSYNNKKNLGILVDDVIIENNNWTSDLHYKLQVPISKRNINGNITTIDEIKEIECWYNLIKNLYSKYFEITNNKLSLKNNVNLDEIKNTLKNFNSEVILLYIEPKMKNPSLDFNKEIVVNGTEFKVESIALILKDVLENIENLDELNLTTDFYLHGQSGLIDFKEDVYPCYWYGKTHPFEFEFVVNDKIGLQKIFSDLVIISNKAEPESFHFEIEGDNYDFSNDKRAMYFRLEATKNLYLNLGSNILYDRKYTDVVANNYTYEQYYRGENLDEYTSQYPKFDKVYPKDSQGLVLLKKSTIFPLYYSRVDTFNDIYDTYQSITGYNRDYQNLSGSEITWNRDLNQFNVITHIKNSPIDKVGRLRGNSHYKEGRWTVQIPSITYMLKNEDSWTTRTSFTSHDGEIITGNYNYSVPPLVVNFIPDDLLGESISVTQANLPNIYNIGQIKTDKWTYRKETKIRDKWIKIKVRYSGHNLAVIHSIITLFNISYA